MVQVCSQLPKSRGTMEVHTKTTKLNYTCRFGGRLYIFALYAFAAEIILLELPQYTNTFSFVAASTTLLDKIQTG